jgi:hypothetical protein
MFITGRFAWMVDKTAEDPARCHEELPSYCRWNAHHERLQRYLYDSPCFRSPRLWDAEGHLRLSQRCFHGARYSFCNCLCAAFTTGQYVFHIGGYMRSSCPGSLEFVRPAEDAWYATYVLGANRSERNGLAKPGEEKVRHIVQLMPDAGLTERRVAERFGVDPATVSLVCRRKTWQHVK